jgi:hypothetical protein
VIEVQEDQGEAALLPVLAGEGLDEQLVERPAVVEVGQAVANRQLLLPLAVLDERQRGRRLVRQDPEHPVRGRVEGAAGPGEDERPQRAVPRLQGHGEKRLGPTRGLVEHEDGHAILVGGHVVEQVGLLRAADHPRRPRLLLERYLALRVFRGPAVALLDDVPRLQLVRHDHRPPFDGNEVSGGAQEEAPHLRLAGERAEAL